MIICHGAGEYKENYYEMCERLAEKRRSSCLQHRQVYSERRHKFCLCDRQHPFPGKPHRAGICNDCRWEACATDFYDTSAKCVDADLGITEVTDALYRELSKLSPFGVGNDKPLFRFRAVTPREVGVFGKSKEHTKIIFETSSATLPAIAFFKTPDSFSVALEAGKPVDLIAHVEKSFFMNRPELRLRIVDVL